MIGVIGVISKQNCSYTVTTYIRKLRVFTFYPKLEGREVLWADNLGQSNNQSLWSLHTHSENCVLFSVQAQGVLSTTQAKQGPAQGQRTGSKSQVAMAKLFDKYNVAETSYHLHTGRIDLHLCDDMAPGEWYRHGDHNCHVLNVEHPAWFQQG